MRGLLSCYKNMFLCDLDKGIEKNAKEEIKNNVKETERIVSDDDPRDEGCGKSKILHILVL